MATGAVGARERNHLECGPRNGRRAERLLADWGNDKHGNWNDAWRYGTGEDAKDWRIARGPRLRCIDQLAAPAMAFLNNPRRRPAMPMNWLSLETVISDAVATIRKCSGRHNAPMDLHLLCVVDFRELSTSLWQLECEQVERLDAQCHGYDRRDRPPRRGIERLRGTVASFMRRVGLWYDGCEQGGRNVTMIKFKGSHFERHVILWGVRGLVARRFRKARRRYRGIIYATRRKTACPSLRIRLRDLIAIATSVTRRASSSDFKYLR